MFWASRLLWSGCSRRFPVPRLVLFEILLTSWANMDMEYGIWICNMNMQYGIWIWNMELLWRSKTILCTKWHPSAFFLTKIAATYIVRCEESDGGTPGAQFWKKTTKIKKHKSKVSRIDQKVSQKMIWDQFCAAFFEQISNMVVPGPSSFQEMPNMKVKFSMLHKLTLV